MTGLGCAEACCFCCGECGGRHREQYKYAGSIPAQPVHQQPSYHPEIGYPRPTYDYGHVGNEPESKVRESSAPWNTQPSKYQKLEESSHELNEYRGNDYRGSQYPNNEYRGADPFEDPFRHEVHDSYNRNQHYY
jgi:hypothetical protein